MKKIVLKIKNNTNEKFAELLEKLAQINDHDLISGIIKKLKQYENVKNKEKLLTYPYDSVPRKYFDLTYIECEKIYNLLNLDVPIEPIDQFNTLMCKNDIDPDQDPPTVVYQNLHRLVFGFERNDGWICPPGTIKLSKLKQISDMYRRTRPSKTYKISNIVINPYIMCHLNDHILSYQKIT